MFDEEGFWPEYLGNDRALVCLGPGDEPTENFIDDTYYVYTGYMLFHDDDVLAFADAYLNQLVEGGDFSKDLPGNPSYPLSNGEILRLREGIERFLITDINNPAGVTESAATIPVMWEWPDNQSAGVGRECAVSGWIC